MSAGKPCRVYWGSHGCELVRGHSGHHFCCCGCEPKNLHPWGLRDDRGELEPNVKCVGAFPYYERTWFYGEDAPLLHRLRMWLQVQAKA